jgi:hypothetical protein
MRLHDGVVVDCYVDKSSCVEKNYMTKERREGREGREDREDRREDREDRRQRRQKIEKRRENKGTNKQTSSRNYIFWVSIKNINRPTPICKVICITNPVPLNCYILREIRL